MSDFSTFSYTSDCEAAVPTIIWPESWKKYPLLGHYGQYSRGSQNLFWNIAFLTKLPVEMRFGEQQNDYRIMKIPLTWTELNYPVTFPLLNSFLKCPLEKWNFLPEYFVSQKLSSTKLPRGYWLRSIGHLETSWIWAKPQIIIWVFESQSFSVVLFSPLWRIYKTSTHPEKQLEWSDNARNSTLPESGWIGKTEKVL